MTSKRRGTNDQAPIPTRQQCDVPCSSSGPEAPFSDHDYSLKHRSTQNAHQLRWASVPRTAELYADVTSEQALRALIWQAEAYEKDPKEGLRSNGFLPVIVRPPNQRKVLIDLVEFEKWLTSRQRKSHLNGNHS